MGVHKGKTAAAAGMEPAFFGFASTPLKASGINLKGNGVRRVQRQGLVACFGAWALQAASCGGKSRNAILFGSRYAVSAVTQRH